ncbi:MAG: nitronate monooxygenase [Acidaminobacteraceae bacterium]
MNLPSLKIGDLLVKLPIIQGGMGVGVSMSNLAAAVAREGGIGIISGAQVGYKEEDFRKQNDLANINGLTKEIRKAKELAPNGLIGVNFLAATNNYADMVRTAVKEKVDLIISGAGIPKNLPELVMGSTTKIAPIVSSAKAADTIVKFWKKRYDRLPDLIVVEGPEAGGHLGFKKEILLEGSAPTIYELTSDIVESMKKFEEKFSQKIPVIAAGGLFSGSDIRAALEAGASGVQISTRLVATVECDAHQNFKQAYIDANADDIELVVSPVGLPGRAIINDFTRRVKAGQEKVTACYRCLNGCNPKTTPYCITEALIASVTGDTTNGLVFVGTNGHLVKKMSTVKEVFNDIKAEYSATFAK